MIILTRPLRGRPAQRGNSQGGFALTNHTVRDWIIYSPSQQTPLKNAHTNTHTQAVFFCWCAPQSDEDGRLRQIRSILLQYHELPCKPRKFTDYNIQIKQEREVFCATRDFIFLMSSVGPRTEALSLWSICRHRLRYFITPIVLWLKEIGLIDTLADAARWWEND